MAMVAAAVTASQMSAFFMPQASGAKRLSDIRTHTQIGGCSALG